MRQCSVPGCKLKNQTIHRFPVVQNLGQLWVTAVGNEQILHMPYESIRKKGLIVCGLHFDNNCYQPMSTRNLLKADAIPTLRLTTKESDSLPESGNSVIDSNSERIRKRNPCESSLVMTEDRRLEINKEVSSYIRLKKKLSLKAASTSSHRLPPQNCDSFLEDGSVIEVENLPSTSKRKSNEVNPIISPPKKQKMHETLESDFQISNVESSTIDIPENNVEKVNSKRPSEDDAGSSTDAHVTKRPRTEKRKRLILARHLDKRVLTPKANQIYSEATEIRNLLNKTKRKVKRYV